MALQTAILAPDIVVGMGAPKFYLAYSGAAGDDLQITVAALAEQIYVLRRVTITFDTVGTAKNETYQLTIGTTVYDLQALIVPATVQGIPFVFDYGPNGIYGNKNQLMTLDVTVPAAVKGYMLADIRTVSA